VALLCCAAGALLAAGCENLGIGPEICARPESAEPTPYKGGSVENGVYMSAILGEQPEELLHFPGGAYYNIYHQLEEEGPDGEPMAVVPRWFQFYLSFERYGTRGSSLAPAAGNQAEVKAVNDQYITVLNATCSDYWLLVMAGAGAEQPEL
jgi:hypothetical protein